MEARQKSEESAQRLQDKLTDEDERGGSAERNQARKCCGILEMYRRLKRNVAMWQNSSIIIVIDLADVITGRDPGRADHRGRPRLCHVRRRPYDKTDNGGGAVAGGGGDAAEDERRDRDQGRGDRLYGARDQDKPAEEKRRRSGKE